MRGAPLCLLLWCIAGSATAAGSTWSNLWSTPEQQAQRLLDSRQAAAAAALFNDPRRRGYAQLRAGEYAQAAKSLAPLHDTESLYNRGNALAHTGQLRDALAAYDAALKQSPRSRDLLHNRDLVARALQKQQQQSPKGQQGSNGSGTGSGRNGQQSGAGGQQGHAGGQHAGSNQQQGPAGGGQQAGSNQQQGGPASGGRRAGSNEQQGGAGSRQQAGTNEPQGRAAGGQQSAAPAQAQAGGSAGQDQAARQGRAAQQGQATQQDQETQQGQATQQGQLTRQGQADSHDQSGAQSGNSAQAASAPQAAIRDERSARATQPPPPPRSEQSLALDQWLRGIPDDSGELLRRKFMIEHMMKQQENAQ